MKMLYFILLLSTFAFSHNNIGIQLDTGKYINGIYKSQNYDPINIQPCSDLSLINANQLFVSFHTGQFNGSILNNSDTGSRKILVVSDSLKKKSSIDRRLERKNRRLQELADKFTVEELQQRIENYKSSKRSGKVLMGVGIPLFAGGLLAYIVGISNVDHSESDGNDDSNGGWLLTAVVGEVVGAVGGILTAYGAIKNAKANSRIRKYQQLLDIKTDSIGLKINRRGLSLYYHF